LLLNLSVLHDIQAKMIPISFSQHFCLISFIFTDSQFTAISCGQGENTIFTKLKVYAAENGPGIVFGCSKYYLLNQIFNKRKEFTILC